MKQIKRTWKSFPVGSTVAYKTISPDVVHEGTVVSVEILPNGYPVTRVNFPNWKGEIEFAVEALRTPDQFKANVNWWAI
jgi:hypothetical protein